MSESIDRFWIPVASVLPVFILAMAVETRIALPLRTKKQRKRDRRQPRWVRVLDLIAAITYGLIYVLTMLLLVFSFAIALGVLAGASSGDASGSPAVDTIYLTALIGAVMTGLLPVLRIAFETVMDRVRPEASA